MYPLALGAIAVGGLIIVLAMARMLIGGHSGFDGGGFDGGSH